MTQSQIVSRLVVLAAAVQALEQQRQELLNDGISVLGVAVEVFGVSIQIEDPSLLDLLPGELHVEPVESGVYWNGPRHLRAKVVNGIKWSCVADGPVPTEKAPAAATAEA